MQALLLPLQVLPLTDLQNRLVLASDDVPCAWGVQAVCLHAPTSHYYFWDPAGTVDLVLAVHSGDDNKYQRGESVHGMC